MSLQAIQVQTSTQKKSRCLNEREDGEPAPARIPSHSLSPRGRSPRRMPVSNTDPFRPTTGGERPSVEAVALGVLSHPLLLEEIFRRLAYADPETLGLLARQIATAQANAGGILQAIREGTFG